MYVCVRVVGYGVYACVCVVCVLVCEAPVCALAYGCVYVWGGRYVWMRMCMCLSTLTCAHVCVGVCMCVYAHTCVCACVCASLCA